MIRRMIIPLGKDEFNLCSMCHQAVRRKRAALIANCSWSLSTTTQSLSPKPRQPDFAQLLFARVAPAVQSSIPLRGMHKRRTLLYRVLLGQPFCPVFNIHRRGKLGNCVHQWLVPVRRSYIDVSTCSVRFVRFFTEFKFPFFTSVALCFLVIFQFC